MNFNAWGERRKPDMSSGPASSAGTTTRGYTGHEMLDDHGLIHDEWSGLRPKYWPVFKCGHSGAITEQ
ncbi:hypothetical protein [Gayadomonas joobiniege]|uniref:hypothetical protein n=1 Tax=Gayadomonas joobiniege TaxID=1234606 RepID=UPI00036456FD|nr:hypothetical protein [Gayadomonas joobiniege]